VQSSCYFVSLHLYPFLDMGEKKLPFKKLTEKSGSHESIHSSGRRTIKFLLLTALISLILPQYAFGYIDFGSGSYFLQILLAVLFGALYAVKVFWANIKLFFRNLLPGKKGNKG
jgi:hypothetical protein